MRLHIYRKNGPEWIYESYIPLRLHGADAVQVTGFSLLGGKAMVQTESASLVELFEFVQEQAGEWRLAASTRNFKPGYENQIRRIQKWSAQSLTRFFSYFRPAGTLAGA
ncbi:MAG: hypothetical protein JNM68_11560 [Dinghuibacter sp.]|nr:hypothetical protein [Dinghuibacter sp.]